MTRIRFALTAMVTALSWAAAAAPAVAQERWPSRPITVVVPYPAGGTSDNQIRLIQDALSKELGQPIVIDNRPGASGAIGAVAVARAQADGHTLVYVNNGVLIAPLMNPKAGYDALKDFKPVGTVSTVPMVLVTAGNVPAKDIASLAAYSKSQPDGILYASAGTASFGHLATARLAQMAGLKAQHVPYKGEANTTMAVLSGEAQMLLTTPSATMLNLVKEGKIHLLGSAASKPSPLLPAGTPNLNKAVPDFTAEAWFGLLAPAGTPDAVVQKINAAVRKVAGGDMFRTKLVPTGALPQVSTPAEFGALMERESAQWRAVIAKYGIKAE